MHKLIVNFLFLLIVFFLTRQFPFGDLSIIMNISCLLILFMSIFIGYKDRLYSIAILYFSLLLLSSILLTDNSPELALRFYIIICLLIGSNFISVGEKTLLYGFSSLMLFQVTVVTCIWIYVTIYFPSGNGVSEFRGYFVRNGFGDVYTHGDFYKVQLKGNALIPFFYMLLFDINLKLKSSKIKSLLFFVGFGVVFCGNFMFLVSVFLFHAYHIVNYIKNKNKTILGYMLKIFGFLSISAIVPIAINIFIKVVEEKSELGASSSMGIRYDQAKVLIYNMGESLFSVFFGKGFGHTLSVVTSSRNYTGDVYYELQSLYFLNQLGFVSFFFLILLLFLLFINKVKCNNIRLIYFCYVIYALSNPYIFDTNHVIVIICLISLQKYKSMTGSIVKKSFILPNV